MIVIPDKIVEALELLPFIHRAQAYAAVVYYMKHEKDSEELEEMGETARSAYILAKAILMPILRRRKRAAARRRAKREQSIEAKMSQTQAPALKEVIDTPQKDTPAEAKTDAGPMFVPRNRAERRRYEREMAKRARRRAV